MIKSGMFVSCPIEYNIDNPVILLGKVISVDINMDTCEITFCKGVDNTEWSVAHKIRHSFNLYEIERAEIQNGTRGWVGHEEVIILCRAQFVSKTEALKDYYLYYCEFLNRNGEIKLIIESQLNADCSMAANKTKISMTTFSTNLNACLRRNLLMEKKSRLDITDEVVKSIVGTRVYLYKHQLDTIIRATQKNVCRIMLADEVGLGKTIEAISIMKHYLNHEASLKCLVIVPESLEYQWVNELREKFDIDANILRYRELLNKKMVQRVTVISVNDYDKYYYEISEKKWGMVVIDEAHKLLNQKVYSRVCKQCQSAKHTILLSATPVLRHAEEYLKLLQLLDYSRYSGMSSKTFSQLVSYQKDIIQTLNDISSDMEMFGEECEPYMFEANLKYIASIINDEYLNFIISKCVNNNEFGMFYVKMANNYIKQKYLIESTIIRHRRNDIPEANVIRCLDEIVLYQMESADGDVFEHNLYQAMLDEINQCLEHDNGKIHIVLNLIQAMFSSPYAVEPLLEGFVNVFENYPKLRGYLLSWKQACEKEINISSKHDSQPFITRFSILKQVIERRNNDSKILIFSEFRETVRNIERMLVNLYGTDSVATFVMGMSRYETQIAARNFQNNPKCRFLVCDKSGGEGRNFQMADCIVHFDMPWSPAQMEQRIGRLDRIGRDTSRDVGSIVICSEETVEENLFNIYHKSLRVFEHSLCGLEIVFEELQNMIISAFSRDIQFGLLHVMSDIDQLVRNMEKEVEDEIYFTNVQNENDVQQKNIEDVIIAFDENHKDESYRYMIDWLESIGISSETEDSKCAGRVTIEFSKANKEKMISNFFDWALKSGNLVGTFSRKYAIQHEDVQYFSTNSIMVKNLFLNLERSCIGRFAAVRNKKNKSKWCGWLFSWKICPNYNLLIRNGLYTDYHGFIERFITEPFFYTTSTIEGETECNEFELRKMLQRAGDWKEIQDLADVKQYEVLFDEDNWQEYCCNEVKKACEKAEERIKSCVWSDKIVDSFIDYVLNRRVLNKKEDICKDVFKAKNVLRNSLLHSSLMLCSAIYIEM